MAPKNAFPTLLDSPQVIKRVFDEADDSIRVTVGAGTSFEVSLDSADGDSVNVSNLLVPVPFDFIGGAYPNSTTEVYTYKTGGSGGTTVATVTVIYTDGTKALITSITRT